MEELDLDGVPLLKMIWTPVKYKPSRVAQFISLTQKKTYKLSKAVKETGIAYNAAYKFNKQWKENEGTVVPGYKLASEVKTKRNTTPRLQISNQNLYRITSRHTQLVS